MKTKFKAGDKVRIIHYEYDNETHTAHSFEVEDTGVVERHEDGDYWVVRDGDSLEQWVTEYELELIETPMKTTKTELQEMIAELESRQKELQLEVAETGENIAKLKVKAANITEPERIRVPENIKFETYGGGFALISPNGKCYLSADYKHGGVPLVYYAGTEDDPNCDIITDTLYLEPCKREDLECGDVAFGTDKTEEMTDWGIIDCYSIVLNDKLSQRWRTTGAPPLYRNETVDCDHWDNWYKVVR